MDVLWAPWRMEYILQNDKPDDCIFCVRRGEDVDELERRLILYTGEFSMVMMNRYPYNNGHLLVAPMKHTGVLDDLEQEELKDLMKVTRSVINILKEVMSPEGFNVGINLGLVAGAGVEEHLHIHIVPRWNGDTNFMAALGQTRVIPEHLLETYRKLRPHFMALA